MIISGNRRWTLSAVVLSVALPLVLLMILMTDTALARRGGDDDQRSEFYGLVKERPENSLQGRWVIGDATITTDAGTEFDQREGTLRVGGCAKVHIRNGRVHEIDSEPSHHCR